MTVSDYPDFGTPGQNVQGAAQGAVGLLRATSTLGSATGQVLGTNLPTNLIALANVTQPGYEALFNLSLPAGVGTVPFLEVIFNWFDSGSGFAVDSEFFMLTAGNGPTNALQYYLNGPVRGDSLTVQVIDLDPAQQATLTWVINQTSHLFEHDRLIQPVYATTAPIGFTNPAGVPALRALVVSSPSLTTGQTLTRLGAACNGRALLTVDNTAGASVFSVSWNDPGTLYSTISAGTLGRQLVAAGANLNEIIALPNGPVNWTFQNHSGAATIQPTIAVTLFPD